MAPRLSSSIGQKLLMAVSGILLLGFVISHLLGNLLIFNGPEVFNAYAAKIKSMGPLLWIARSGLLLVLVVHVFGALRLTAANRAAAGPGYRVSHNSKASLASLTMLISGLVILAFVAFHIAHFTTGHVGAAEHFAGNVQVDGHHDVYGMLIHAFSNPQSGLVYTALYVAAMAGLGFHLAHAANSALQTFGINSEELRQVCHAIAIAISVGFLSIPAAIHLRLIGS